MARKMKDSGIEWIGMIPEEWDTIRIKNLANHHEENSFIDGDWIESPYIIDSGIRYLTTGNIGDGEFKRQGNGYISLDTFKELNCKYVYPGDLVFSRLNGPYGRSCILPEDNNEYIMAVDNVVLRTEQNKSFISRITQCDGYQHAVEDEAKGTTMKRISRTNLGNIKVPIPPVHEQQKIASYLDSKIAKIDEAISKTRSTIEEYKVLKQSVITKAVTKGIRGDRPMKDSGIEWIGEIPEEWRLCRLMDISTRIGVGLATSVTPYYREEGTVLLRNLNIKDGWLDDSELLYLDENFASTQTGKIIYKNDLLTVHTGSNLGLTCIVPEKYDGALSFTTLITTPDFHRVYPKYLCYSMNSKIGSNETIRLQDGDIKPNLNVKKFKYMVVALPTMGEQWEVVKYLDSKCSTIDEIISKKEQLITELESYKKSLIYEYVTGKKEVPEYGN